jgi:putative acetyltransferase
MPQRGACEKSERPAVLVRSATREDAHALWDIVSCPGVVRGTLQLPYQSPEEWLKRLTEPRPNTYQLVAETAGRVVGSLSLTVNRGRRAHAAGIGMAVHDDFQGKGVGTALLAAAIELAERWLGVHRIELDVYTDNEPALRLYRRFGFVVEGTLRRFALRDGQWVDAHLMARLAPLPGEGGTPPAEARA